MDINEATRSYEGWMRQCAPIVEKHLRDKHARMKEDPFQFLRGTYYRWAQLWSETGAQCVDAPEVLSVGDLHLDSFGTWRDSEGRLSWGVDDFDEAFPLPYTNDLLRLMASVKVAHKLGLLVLKTKPGCEIIVDAYRRTLTNGGCPIVLAEGERQLEKLGIAALKTPEHFWEKLNARPSMNGNLPADARSALEREFSDRSLEYRVVRREAGLGSLGQQRFVAIAERDGGFIAREAKRLVPAANFWLKGKESRGQPFYGRILAHAIRSHDPHFTASGCWLIRRLSPDSNPIHLEELSCKRDEETLLRAMGTEIANVHLGNCNDVKPILRDLDRRPCSWFAGFAKTLGKRIVREWKEYCD